jgi:hypothetical protein
MYETYNAAPTGKQNRKLTLDVISGVWPTCCVAAAKNILPLLTNKKSPTIEQTRNNEKTYRAR